MKCTDDGVGNMSMYMTVNEDTSETESNKDLDDVEYYVTRMQDSGSRVEVKVQNKRKIDMSLPDDNVIEVTCGHLVGYLHRDRFYCPGIHRECIEVNGEFVTPKKFSVLGDKQRLKDWKNALRINNRQIRKYIDSGELTFWNHDSLCTGRCIARSPAIRPASGMAFNPESEPKSDSNYRFETLTTTISSAPGLPSQVSLLIPESINQAENISMAKGDGSEWDSGDVDIKPDVEKLQAQMLAATKLQPIISHPQPVVSSMPGLTTIAKPVSYTYPMTMTAASPSASEETTDEDDRMLWKGIVELGLIDEFFREIKAALDLFKNDMIRRFVPLDASKKISVIVKELGLMSKLRYKLGAHKSDMDRQRQKLDREMEDLQRRVKEYEMKKAMLKRKSECFDQLIDITALKKEEDDYLIKQPRLAKEQPSPMIVFPSKVVMSSSGDSMTKTVADSGSTSEPQKMENMMYMQVVRHSDDQNGGTDCESESEQNLNNDSESSQESSKEKGDNTLAKVDSTTDENAGDLETEQTVKSENEDDDDLSQNTNENASGMQNEATEFTKIRSSNRKRMQKSLDSEFVE